MSERMRTTKPPPQSGHVETLGDADWEQCSFCAAPWTVRQYESVAHCAAHVTATISDLRRERDEAQAALASLASVVRRADRHLRHARDCAAHAGGECDCGFEAACCALRCARAFARGGDE